MDGASLLPRAERADRPEQVAEIARAHWQLGCESAVVVTVPVPIEDEVPADEIGAAIDEALAQAAQQQVSGKVVTPFLLTQIAERTGGRALRANIALLHQNARLAAEIARALGT